MSDVAADRRHTATVGVLGGGQLGRMLALAGAPLGIAFRFLDPDPHATAGDLGEQITGRFDDPEALSRFARGLDAITYEFENVPAATAEWLAARPREEGGTSIYPPASALAIAQDRLQEKRAFESAGLEVPPYAPVSSVEELRSAIRNSIGLPCVLKTRRMGYDGKGQAVIESEAQVDAAFARVAGHVRQPGDSRVGGASGGARPEPELLVERFVPFEREVSLICVRGLGGATRVYPITENQHRGGILRTSMAPARNLDAGVEREAHEIADRLLTVLDYRGVLALELFVVRSSDGRVRLLGNEMAPRVHNSGHWTMDGAIVGQFENHLRAILGWPLGASDLLATEGADTVWGMVNLIGGPVPDLGALATEPWMRVHLYGKSARPGRKIGHVNVRAANRAVLQARMEHVRGIFASARAD